MGPHQMRAKGGVAALLGLLAAGLAGPSWAGGLFLYEMATRGLGTASAGRAAAADNAATAFGNPAGMIRLDTSQVLVGIQPTASAASTRETILQSRAATAATPWASFPGSAGT